MSRRNVHLSHDQQSPRHDAPTFYLSDWALHEATLALGLRQQQQIVVEHFLRGNDVFVSLPTGSGKSLCYCLLPKAFDLRRDSNSVTKQS